MFTSDACQYPHLLYILSFGMGSQDLALAGFILTTECVSDRDFELSNLMAVSSIVLSEWQRLPGICDLDTLIAPARKSFSYPGCVSSVCSRKYPRYVRNLAFFFWSKHVIQGAFVFSVVIQLDCMIH